VSVSVLVVDDEQAIRDVLSRWLGQLGYRVRVAGSAVDAIELMLIEPASILFCDVRMPVHDGLWLLKRVREEWPRTATIMASGIDDLDVIQRAQKAGAVDYVSKPFGREMLLQALNRAQAALNA
jgi:CheY-like chemotaxis protein